MRITDLCIGCGICLPYCPVEAIWIAKDSKHALIDYGRCTFCGTCYREAPCPVKGAIVEIPFNELSGPQKFARQTVDKLYLRQRAIGVATAVIFNQTNPEVRPGEVGVGIEVGRPLVHSSFGSVQEVVSTLAKAGFNTAGVGRNIGTDSELPHPSYYPEGAAGLKRNMLEGTLPEEFRRQRITGYSVSIAVKLKELPRLLDVIMDMAKSLNNVLTITINQTVEKDHTLPAAKILDQKGIRWAAVGETLFANPELPYQMDGSAE